MKRILCIFLVFILCCGLFACGNAPEPTAGSSASEPAASSSAPEVITSWLQAGFARMEAIPDFTLGDIGLDGSGNAATRRCTEVLDPLTVTCIALSDENSTILVYTADTLGYNNNVLALLRTQISVATYVPQDQIFFGATHTHSAPRLLQKDDAGQAYLGVFCKAMIDAGKAALEDLSPAELYATTADLPDMNFVRHYKMSDGSYAGPNFGTFEGLDIEDYSGTVDPELSLIKLNRGEGKQDILMMNWQAHPNRSSELGYYKISADFVGAARNKLEAETGMLVAYFTGASGNVHIDSRLPEDQHNMKWNVYGEKLAEMTLDILPDLSKIGGTGISFTGNFYPFQIDHSTDDLVPQAQEVVDLWKTQSKEAGDKKGAEYGFSSVYQANTIVEKAQLGKSLMMELRAFRVGDLGFTTGTYEMFTESGKYVKDNSPFEITFIITGNLLYIPNEAAFAYRNYEADTTYFVKGTAEELTDIYVQLLQSLK